MMSRTVGIWLVVAACGNGVLAGVEAEVQAGKDTLTLFPRVRMETTLGDIVLQLNAEKAPGTVLNFVRYAEEGFYNGTIFHRVIKKLMIQGGAFTTDLALKTKGLRSGIKNEWRNGLRNRRGSIAMARLGNKPDSAKASFYINVVDNGYFDRAHDGAAYCVFGKVLEGMDMVDKIRDVPVKFERRIHPGSAVLPAEPVVITAVRVLDRLDVEGAKKLAASFDATILRAKEEAKASVAGRITARIERIERENGAKLTRTPSGLLYLDLEIGGGMSPTLHDTVKVHYRGTFADDSEFDDSRTDSTLNGAPLESIVSELIDGWAEGLLSMHVGGKRILVIPPELAFGSRGHPKVAPNSTLFYEVELVEVIPVAPPPVSPGSSGGSSEEKK